MFFVVKETYLIILIFIRRVKEKQIAKKDIECFITKKNQIDIEEI